MSQALRLSLLAFLILVCCNVPRVDASHQVQYTYNGWHHRRDEFRGEFGVIYRPNPVIKPHDFFRHMNCLPFNLYNNYMCAILKGPKPCRRYGCSFGLGKPARHYHPKKAPTRAKRLKDLEEWLLPETYVYVNKPDGFYYQWARWRWERRQKFKQVRVRLERTPWKIMSEIRAQLLEGVTNERLTTLGSFLHENLTFCDLHQIINVVFDDTDALEPLIEAAEDVMVFYVKDFKSTKNSLHSPDLKRLMVNMILSANGMTSHLNGYLYNHNYYHYIRLADTLRQRLIDLLLPGSYTAYERHKAMEALKFLQNRDLDMYDLQEILDAFVFNFLPEPGLDMKMLCYVLNNFAEGSDYCGVSHIVNRMRKFLKCPTNVILEKCTTTTSTTTTSTTTTIKTTTQMPVITTTLILNTTRTTPPRPETTPPPQPETAPPPQPETAPPPQPETPPPPQPETAPPPQPETAPPPQPETAPPPQPETAPPPQPETAPPPQPETAPPPQPETAPPPQPETAPPPQPETAPPPQPETAPPPQPETAPPPQPETAPPPQPETAPPPQPETPPPPQPETAPPPQPETAPPPQPETAPPPQPETAPPPQPETAPPPQPETAPPPQPETAPPPQPETAPPPQPETAPPPQPETPPPPQPETAPPPQPETAPPPQPETAPPPQPETAPPPQPETAPPPQPETAPPPQPETAPPPIPPTTSTSTTTPTTSTSTTVITTEIPKARCGISGVASSIAPMLSSPLLVTARIVGGTVTGSCRTFPWMAHIAVGTDQSCAGTILSKTHILTAAHCVVGGNPLRITVGEYNTASVDGPEQVFDVNLNTGVFAHRDFNATTMVNDIAVLKLDTEIEFDRPCAEPICLEQQFDIQTGETCTVAGWGATRDLGSRAATTLRSVALPVYEGTECDATFPKKPASLQLHDKPNQLCAGQPKEGQIDSCKGDSGAPLMCQNPKTNTWVAVGVVSYGYFNTCGRAGIPGVYTRVPNYYAWIQDQMNK